LLPLGIQLENLGDDDIALGPLLEVKTVLPLSVVLVRCRRPKSSIVLQGTTKSTRKKFQELGIHLVKKKKQLLQNIQNIEPFV